MYTNVHPIESELKYSIRFRFGFFVGTILTKVNLNVWEQYGMQRLSQSQLLQIKKLVFI